MVPTTAHRTIQRATKYYHRSLLAARAKLQSERPDALVTGHEIRQVDGPDLDPLLAAEELGAPSEK